jgi:hypothetical protein
MAASSRSRPLAPSTLAHLLRDRETGTRWSWLRGEAIEGALKGKRLESVSHNPILVERFKAFYPDGPVFGR